MFLRTGPNHFTTRSAAARRGVAAMLAVIAMTILTSLCAAMAVVSQGNIRTSVSHQQVSIAMSAAETGLNFAARRLASESKRFVTTKGVIDEDYGTDLWMGEYPNDGSVDVLPSDGYTESGLPDGLAQAVMHAHEADADTVEIDSDDQGRPYIDGFGTLRAKSIALNRNAAGLPDKTGPYFRLKYESVAGTDDTSYVRVTCMGVGGAIHRTLQMDFQITKKIKFAVVAPSRIMIGKNVRVEGPLGTRYGLVGTCADTPPGELCSANGDPLVMKSDFYYLDPQSGVDAALNHTLNVFYAAVVAYDADGDGRLRVYHPTEQDALVGELADADYDGNEYVDDFDLFLKHFDVNPQDGAVVYDTVKASIYGGNPPVEFSVDNQLARLIDRATPDRDGDGVVTYPAGDPSWPGSDNLLGYDDGKLDLKDNYAKVKGRLYFAISRAEWDAANGASYQTVVQGPIVPGLDRAPVTFEASEEDLRALTTEMMQTSQSVYEAMVPGTYTLAQLVTECTSSGGTYTPAGAGTWESIPFEAPGAYDFMMRPQFRGATFRNVRIPMGTNALFDDCKFIGVTFIECYEHCVDEYWNYTGAMEQQSPGVYVEKFVEDSNLNPPSGLLVGDTKPYSNAIRFNDCTFVGTVAADKPEVLVHWRDKIECTGNTRFYLDKNDPDLQTQADADDIKDDIDSLDPDDLKELLKSMWYTAGWSVDVGNFTNVQDADPALTPRVNFKGAIVAGIMDVRGTADIFGSMINTYHPVANEGPLFFGGLPPAFNATIGYFGPADGDGEGVDPADATFSGFGEITLRYNDQALLPDGIRWMIGSDPDPGTYFEGGTM